MSFLSRLFTPKSGLLCAHCERPLEGHDEGACRRRISRRHFFGVAFGAATVATASVAAPKVVGYLFHKDAFALVTPPVSITPEFITREILAALEKNLSYVRYLNQQVAADWDLTPRDRTTLVDWTGKKAAEIERDRDYLKDQMEQVRFWPSGKRGETIQIRRPARFSASGEDFWEREDVKRSKEEAVRLAPICPWIMAEEEV